MRRIINRIGTRLFALLFTLSLAFGAHTVLAQPAPASECPVDYAAGDIGVACRTNADCTAPCQFYYPDSPGGFCRAGCCRCAI
jgi:hypothetical protein